MTDQNIMLEWVGSEREPVVVIDGFAPDATALRQAAYAADFSMIGDYYPGERAPAPPGYIQDIGSALSEVLREFFDYRDGGELIRSYYSIASTPPEQLALAQRIPHTDAYDDHQIAILHFLGRSDLGGTSFFRHRSTGFETINAARVDAYHAALNIDFEKHGEPMAAYIGESSPVFERVHLCKYAFNRALIYRGKLLHCAALDAVTTLPTDAAHGRLTIASFVAPKRTSGKQQ